MDVCLPLGKIPFPLTSESIRLNGVSMHIIFLTFIASRIYFVGWKLTILILALEYIISIIVKYMFLQKNFKQTSEVSEGDVIIVCRGGVAGEASDLAELFMYHVSGLLYTGTIYGHVGQVFKDYDGQLKVADVRFNKKHKNSTRHYIDTVPDFIDNYEGKHYIVKRDLTYDENMRLTKAVHLIAENTGHCTDCFNPIRLAKVPNKDASPDEILEFGKAYGFGCAENINFIQRIAGVSKIDDRFVLPHHFSRNEKVCELKVNKGN
jgi:hypothetical protein